MNVETSERPNPSNSSRSRSILTRCPPTLMPRRNAMYCRIPLLSQYPESMAPRSRRPWGLCGFLRQLPAQAMAFGHRTKRANGAAKGEADGFLQQTLVRSALGSHRQPGPFGVGRRPGRRGSPKRASRRSEKTSQRSEEASRTGAGSAPEVPSLRKPALSTGAGGFPERASRDEAETMARPPERAASRREPPEPKKKEPDHRIGLSHRKKRPTGRRSGSERL
jgi:hypothetical protein